MTVALNQSVLRNACTAMFLQSLKVCAWPASAVTKAPLVSVVTDLLHHADVEASAGACEQLSAGHD